MEKSALDEISNLLVSNKRGANARHDAPSMQPTVPHVVQQDSMPCMDLPNATIGRIQNFKQHRQRHHSNVIKRASPSY
jgi:hypothetical protein